MTRGVRLYLVGSIVLVSLAGCGRGFFQTAEREPWRHEAEVACLKSGAVREAAGLVRIEPITGPGVCGADFPLKVAALDSGSATGFADELRPPGGIPNGQPRWPISRSVSPPSTYPAAAPSNGSYQASPNGGGQGPVSLRAPGVASSAADEIELPADGAPEAQMPAEAGQRYAQPGYSAAREPQPEAPLPRLGPAQAPPVAAIGPVSVKPAATLACPIVSMLDRWIADSVQPAAMRWFGAPVVEIKQISAYSCRGMNGNPNAHISEHAFGNALDVAGFTLADGRRISVKDGWRGLAEEQGFLRDVQGGACQLFNTVLAPGSNVYHYDHIHVDLMRRSSGRIICQPAAVGGEQVAARVMQRSGYASRDAGITGSIGRQARKIFSGKLSKDDEATIEDESRVRDSER
ncbi:extensin family protein [Bradyrhizobium sp. U87765 SZCCT0131]|uniref:extensin family protein n=1 Tax=unclassified Bradyrhizobium TaxID=2631580 RepID=UPI001BA60E4A|nr:MULTISPECIES: extensin family protein [unclassified Bradyrhizobium]MBR1218405.1 extensin family protein [Bradyrhizobium sp. U87765 SZCCT0131]MBR1260649.1 extensin family protein [Bradyrhizobium sp. U87765 SZCCT0134]MBR1303903.1 extensin family protein [Bradyrhizobium sp. U87765 SZCCT0110]MBR1319509.1 extensin family protein [Bradyrhizobium sp. U87765 SZCCT0109]MBR1347834.1 extensin family protein [Bradyrhizobium sp. U87765 SZCCT0048]